MELEFMELEFQNDYRSLKRYYKALDIIYIYI